MVIIDLKQCAHCGAFSTLKDFPKDEACPKCGAKPISAFF